MWKPMACVLLLAPVLQARDLPSRRSSCPDVCEPSRCDTVQFCFFGVVEDSCGCCSVCAMGEGEHCGESGRRVCGVGMRCERPGTCVCESREPVCGSDGRTYPTICRLKAESKRGAMSGVPTVILIQRGPCETGSQNPSSMRYKFNFIADVVDKIAPAVVHLELFSRPLFPNQDVTTSSGSGFIVSEDGWIVTNAHVVSAKERIKVELKNGMLYDATVKDMDQKSDIALIKIDSETAGKEQSESAGKADGNLLFVQRSGLQEQPAESRLLCRCSCSAVLQTLDQESLWLPLEAPFPFRTPLPLALSAPPSEEVMNLDGDVIGINTLKVTPGISFAIPSDRVRQFLMDFYISQRKAKTQTKKYMGVRMLQLSPDLIRELKEKDTSFPDVSSGVYVYEVIPGTAAFSAGLANKDVIISMNGQAVQSTEDVSQGVQSNEILSLVVRRANEEITLTVVPEEVD
ncbi:hypothetical protein DNTS_023708 [Danionella cerebrum]|uniref:HtrA serine peptidase 4 n=1 Tax=Danionella cerebrum TaxID=2873325 RepID=A0A553MMP1_9TELE|nr:hypothetical protein DNTS_023708 [Danionella translucida]